MAKTTDDNVVPLLQPVHLIGEAPRGRGRPPKVEPAPTKSDLDYNAAIIEERQGFVAAHPLVQAVDEKNPKKVLEQTAAALAAEAAALEHLRGELEKRGRDFSMISSRRSAILCELTRTQIKIRDLDPQIVDLRSEAMTSVFKAWLETLAQVAREVLPVEQFNVLFSRLETEFDGWEEETAAKLR